MPDIRILAVDDSASIQVLLQLLLSAAGYQVVTSDGPRQALRELRTFDPHIILTDFNMPKIDGHAFVRLLRRNPRFERTPIFVLSSETGTVKRDRMKDAGANGWFSKPVRADHLLAGLHTVGETVGPAGPQSFGIQRETSEPA